MRLWTLKPVGRTLSGFLLLLVGFSFQASLAEPLPDPKSLIEQVMRTHPSVLKLDELVKAAEAKVRGSRLQPNPTLTLAATAGDPGEDANSLTQFLEISGQPRLRYEAANAELAAARQRRRSMRRRIASETYLDWLELWQSQELDRLASLRLTLTEQLVKAATRRYEVGEIPQNEALRVELAGSQAQSDRETALARKNAALKTIELLQNLLPPNGSVAVTGSESTDLQSIDSSGLGQETQATELVELEPEEAPWTLIDVLASASEHPDVIALEEQRNALGFEADLIGKQGAPLLGLSAYQSNFLPNHNQLQQGLQLSLTWQVWDWGRISTQKEERLAEATAKGFEVSEQAFLFRKEVITLWNSLQAAVENRRILASQAERYEELAREGRIAYDLGLMSLTDVFQTENAFRQAGTDLIKARAEVVRLQLEILQRTNLPWPTYILEENL